MASRFDRISPEVRERISDLMPWQFSEFGEYGISYHKCRFCGLGSETFEGLWKYGVRHYVCTDCRDVITGRSHPPIYHDEHGDWAAANRGAKK